MAATEVPQQPQGASVLKLITTTPAYLIRYVVGFALAIISDVTITSLTVGSVAVGIATQSPWWGLAVFFLAHTAIRITNAVTSATITAGTRIAQAGHRLSSIFEQTNSARPVLDPTSEPASEE